MLFFCLVSRFSTLAAAASRDGSRSIRACALGESGPCRFVVSAIRSWIVTRFPVGPTV